MSVHVDSETGAGEEAWRPFLDGLRGFLARHLPAQEVGDVFQDVMVRLHKGLTGLRDTARAESWIYGIARRAVADFYRARAARLEREELPAEDDLPGGDMPAKGFGRYRGSHSVHEEVLSWLEPMARELPPGYREALLMADFEGRPQAEVARALGLSLSGAKSRIQRARAKLRRKLQICCEVQIGPDGKVVDFNRRNCDC